MRQGTLAPLFALLLAGAARAAEKPPTAWNPAASCNYTNISYDRGIQYVVIHVAEGKSAGTIAWFKNCSSNVSAHYTVAYSGAITQMVADQDIAWHAGNWNYNVHSIGIEHDGYTYKNYWTLAQYQKSAELTRWICLTYGVPMDRDHIIGHIEVPGATHTDPGPYFNWNYYMSLVTQGSWTPPAATAVEVTVSSLNVRSGPSTGNSVIGGIKDGQRYVSIATSGPWRKIYFKGNTGWCYAGYLASVTGGTGVQVDVSVLNVRTGPSTGYSAVGSVSDGQRYIQAGTSNGWRKIWWGGGAYWIYGGYASTFGY